MSVASTKLWLERALADDWYESQMPITQQHLDHAVGFRAFRSMKDEPSTNAWKALEKVIPKIEDRTIIFMPSSKMIVRDSFMRTALKKLSPHWSIDGRCACGSNQYLPVMLEKEYYACYHCIPPSQYPALGAKPVDRSLIHDAMKNYYIAQ